MMKLGKKVKTLQEKTKNSAEVNLYEEEGELYIEKWAKKTLYNESSLKLEYKFMEHLKDKKVENVVALKGGFEDENEVRLYLEYC